MVNGKILLVDSEEPIRHVILNVLRNYSVLAVDSSGSALKILNEEPFDLVLINLTLKPAHSLFLKIKELYKDLPCLLLISPQEVETAVEFLKTGIYGFILKPFTRQEMLATIEESLWKFRLLNENVRLKLLLPLFEMTQNIGVRPEFKDIFDKIVNLIMRETGADMVSFSYHNFLNDPVFDEVKTTPAGARQDIISFIQWVKTHFKHLESPILITGSGEEYQDAVNQIQLIHYSSLMVYPLRSKNHLTGFLICGKISGKNHFFARDHEFFSIIGNQLAIVLENHRLIQELENAHFESLKGLASAIEAKDAYTSGHCDRLIEHSLMFADKLNLSDEERKKLRYGAALHDIGKIGIKESILGKPGKLTAAEYEEMKRHPRIGADILQNINFLKRVIPIIYHHQECYDGSGYPDGISGEQIPLGSRIVAIVDTFDAMTTDRPYRQAVPVQRAIDELNRYAGKQFDPYLVKIFTDFIQEKA